MKLYNIINGNTIIDQTDSREEAEYIVAENILINNNVQQHYEIVEVHDYDQDHNG